MPYLPVASGVDHLHPVVHQLEGIAVAGHDQHIPAFGGRRGGNAADDVVGLVPGHAELGDPQCVQHLVDQR
jgi:hypothetical protein